MTMKLHKQIHYQLRYLLNENMYLMVKPCVIHSDKHPINSKEKLQQQKEAGRLDSFSHAGLKLHDHEVHPQREELLQKM